MSDKCLYNHRILALEGLAAALKNSDILQEQSTFLLKSKPFKWLSLTWTTSSFTLSPCPSPQPRSRLMLCLVTTSELLLSRTLVASQHDYTTKQIRPLSVTASRNGQLELLDAKGVAWHSSTVIKPELRVETEHVSGPNLANVLQVALRNLLVLIVRETIIKLSKSRG